jgi:hypothetical protein
MKVTEAEHCERTGRLVGHCACGDCYARKLAELARQDAGLGTVTKTRPGHPRYLVTASL